MVTVARRNAKTRRKGEFLAAGFVVFGVGLNWVNGNQFFANRYYMIDLLGSGHSFQI